VNNVAKVDKISTSIILECILIIGVGLFYLLKINKRYAVKVDE
jgi:hypothetical protein